MLFLFNHLSRVTNVGSVLVVGGSALVLNSSGNLLGLHLDHGLRWHAGSGGHNGHHGLACHWPDHGLAHAWASRSRGPELVLHVHHAAAGAAALLRPTRLSHTRANVGLALAEESLRLRDGGHEVATLLGVSHLKRNNKIVVRFFLGKFNGR